jgi:hypothetical protein
LEAGEGDLELFQQNRLKHISFRVFYRVMTGRRQALELDLPAILKQNPASSTHALEYASARDE